MKTSQIKSRVTLSILVLMIASISLQAQDRRGPHPDKQGREQMHRGEEGPRKPGPPPIPGMTEQQKEQMKAIHLETEKAALPIKNEIGEKEARLKTLITTASYDEKAVNKVLEEIGSLKTDVEKLKIAGLQKAKEVLTEEQLVFLYKHMDKKRGPAKGRGR